MKLKSQKLIITACVLFLGITKMQALSFERYSNYLIAPLQTTAELESQSITAANFKDGDLTWHTNRSGTFYLDKETETKKLTLTKNDAGEVTQLQLGDYTYVSDEHEKAKFVRYFKSEKGSWKLFFTEKSIIIFSGNDEFITILGCLGGKCKYSVTDKIKAQLVGGKELQKADLEAYKIKKAEIDKAAALEKEAKFSIKDKKVSKIEIINLKTPEKFGHYVGFTFDIKTTLTDGTVLSTDNGGFWSDYIVTYDGGSYQYGKIEGVFIKNDKITINVVSKFDATKKASAPVVPLYNQDIYFNYNGISRSLGNGESANSYRIEVKQMKHKENGTEILAVRITNTTTSKVEAEFKMGVDQTLKFYCKGGSGGKDNGRGSDGANGGNINIIKDPSVKTFNIIYENFGGKGGKGNNASYDGRAGRDGIYKEENRAVIF